MVCGDPESGTDHSLKEVSAYIVWYRMHTWVLQGKHHKLCSVLFCVYLHMIYMFTSLKNPSTEGTCVCIISVGIMISKNPYSEGNMIPRGRVYLT